jgi:hypothetical protein
MTRRAILLLCALLLLLPGCKKKHHAPDPPQAMAPGPTTFREVKDLPDPFRLESGRRVRSRSDWEKRRAEIKEILLTHQYGRLPPAPRKIEAREISRDHALDGAAIQTRVHLTVLAGQRQIHFHLGLTMPRAAEKPRPAIVHIDHRGLFKVPRATMKKIVSRGYVLADCDPNFLDPDQPGTVGAAQAAHPDHDWATLAVWAWGAMRAADHLVGQRFIDAKRLAVTGHSRSGKAALLAGALDERFAAVVPQGSGCGGMASYRYINSEHPGTPTERKEGAQQRRGVGPAGPQARRNTGERLAQITRSFPHWFLPGLRRFAGHEGRLPFDQHLVAALVAPRALLSIDAHGDLWASPRATQQTYLAAREVYRFLGAEERVGIHIRPGRHELSADDWLTLLAFVDGVFGKPQSGRSFNQLPFPEEGPRFSWSAPARK